MAKSPRQYALVKFTTEGIKGTLFDHSDFKIDDTFTYLGEHPNMKGHCIVVAPSGLVFRSFHIGDFQEIPSSDLEFVIATIKVKNGKVKIKSRI